MTVKVSLAYKESDLTTAVDALVDRCEKLLRRLVDMGVTGDVLSMHTASLVHAAEDLLGSGEGGSIQCARTLLTKADQWSADEGCWSTGPSHAHTRSMLRGQLFLCRGVADAIDHAPPEGADLLSTAKNHLHQALSLTKGLKTEACLTTMIRASVALAWVHVRLSCSASAVIHAENARDACMAGAHSGDGVRCLAARVLSAVSHETAVIAKYGEAVKQWSEAMVSASAAASVAKEFPGYGDPAVVNALPLIKEQLKLCKLRSQALFPRAQTNACAASLLGGLVPPAILLSNSHSLPLLRRSLCRLENTLSCGESPLALQFPSAASLKHTSPPPHGTRAKKRPPPPGNHRSSPAAVQHQHGTVSRKKRPASVHGRSGGGGSGGGGVRIGGGLTTSSVRRGQRGVGGSVKAGMRSPRGGGGGRLAAGGGAAEAQQHALGYCHGPAPHSQHYDSAANLPPGSPAELCALDQPPGDGSPNESSPPSPPPLPPAAAAAAASTVRPSSPATKRFSTPSHRAPVHARPSPPARFKTVIPYSPPEAAVVLALDGCDVPPPPPPPLPPSPRGRPALSSKQGSKCYKRPGASARAASTGVHLSRSDVRMRCSLSRGSLPPSPPPPPPAAAAAATASTVRPSSPATKRFSTPSHRAPVHARPSPPARFKTVIPYSPPEAAVVLALDGCDVPPPPPPPPRGRPALSSKQGSACYKRPGASARAASTGVHLSRSDVRMRCSGTWVVWG
ncbi:hypothetical protein DIPPA_02282 [Diplonema papillatum]|nr:hypothetical protein DIPPA_02282 [Diplonema papillatum]